MRTISSVLSFRVTTLLLMKRNIPLIPSDDFVFYASYPSHYIYTELTFKTMKQNKHNPTQIHTVELFF